MNGLSFALQTMGLIVASLTFAVARAEERQPASPFNQSILLQDSSGRIQTVAPKAAESARVFVFLTGECPISTSFIPTLNRLAGVWAKQQPPVSIVAIYADATATPAVVARFATEYQLSFPVLLDRDQELARRLKPTHIPEAFVMTAEGEVAYRGRIDDTYADVGKRRPQPTDHSLADAVAAVVAGNAVKAPRTEAIGCLLEAPAEEAKLPENVTFTRHIAPILNANCTICHREGEVGPFSLASYEDAAKRAQQIARVTDDRLMPPWMPSDACGDFEGDRRLTPRQIALLRKWSETGRATGTEEDGPPSPTFVSGWRLGEPDVVLEMAEDFEIPADGADIFQNFVIPHELSESKLVAAIDFVPGNRRVVHHNLMFLDSRGVARKKDQKTPEYGYPSFGGPGFTPSGGLGGWSAGKTPKRLANGLGRYWAKGSDVVMQIHYHPTGKPEKDRSKVGIYFVKEPRNVAADIWTAAYAHDIPPGEKNYSISASYTTSHDVDLLGIVPHMHLLGRTVRATASLPDGTQKLLIDIPRWDFNWQDDYRFVRPLKLPIGTKIDVTAIYDNSDENPSNPSSPPQRVVWGEETQDEMLYCFLLISTANARQDLPVIYADVLTREGIGQAFGRKQKKSPPATK